MSARMIKALSGASLWAIVSAAAANAAVVPGSAFSGGIGMSSGLDPYGNTWAWRLGLNCTGCAFTSNWEDDALTTTYAGIPDASDFEISFTGLAAVGATIDAANSHFIVEGTLIPQDWNMAVNGSQVTFTAPTGDVMTTSEIYLI